MVITSTLPYIDLTFITDLHLKPRVVQQLRVATCSSCSHLLALLIILEQVLV